MNECKREKCEFIETKVGNIPVFSVQGTNKQALNRLRDKAL